MLLKKTILHFFEARVSMSEALARLFPGLVHQSPASPHSPSTALNVSAEAAPAAPLQHIPA